MAANSPEEICELFKRYMAAGDLEGLLSLYDDEVVFLNRAREMKRGHDEIAPELARMAEVKVQFHFKLLQVIRSGDIALMHTDWEVLSPQPMRVYAIEVARRSPDGTWRWLVGDPFTVSRYMQFCEVKAA